MGLFDRFKKRVNEVIDDTDIEKISADSESEEAKEIIQNVVENSHDDDEWEELGDSDEQQFEVDVNDSDDDWEDLDDDFEMPPVLTRKEQKRLKKEQKKLEKNSA